MGAEGSNQQLALLELTYQVEWLSLVLLREVGGGRQVSLRIEVGESDDVVVEVCEVGEGVVPHLLNRN